VNTNVNGTLLLVHKVARDMRRASSGRILITGSIAGLMPGTAAIAHVMPSDMLAEMHRGMAQPQR
jgi:hypothetical protein